MNLEKVKVLTSYRIKGHETWFIDEEKIYVKYFVKDKNCDDIHFYYYCVIDGEVVYNCFTKQSALKFFEKFKSINDLGAAPTNSGKKK